MPLKNIIFAFLTIELLLSIYYTFNAFCVTVCCFRMLNQHNPYKMGGD